MMCTIRQYLSFFICLLIPGVGFASSVTMTSNEYHQALSHAIENNNDPAKQKIAIPFITGRDTLSGKYWVETLTGREKTICDASSVVGADIRDLIPQGYVVIRRGGVCTNTSYIKLTVKIPSKTTEEICINNTPVPLPLPYMIVKDRQDNLTDLDDCKNANDSVIIQKVTEDNPPRSICDTEDADFPNGFTAGDKVNYGNCKGDYEYLLNIIGDSGGTSCSSLEDFGEELVITEYDPLGFENCYKLLDVSSITGGQVICPNHEVHGDTNGIPGGFILEEIIGVDDGRNKCGNRPAYSIRRPAIKPTNYDVCSSSPIPVGYAFKRVIDTSSSMCGNSARYSIGPLSSGDVVCFDTLEQCALPKDWVATRKVETHTITGFPQSGCPGGAYEVSVAQSGMPICDLSDMLGTQCYPNGLSDYIPENYVFTTEELNGCANFSDRLTIKIPGDSEWVCSESPRPKGYVISQSSDIGGSCEISRRRNQIEEANGPGPYTDCVLSFAEVGQLHPGYVITASSLFGEESCGSAMTVTIQLPVEDENHICQASPIPEDFYIVGYEDLGECNTGSDDYIIDMLDPNGETIICVSTEADRLKQEGYTVTTVPNYARCDGVGYRIRPANISLYPRATSIGREEEKLEPISYDCDNSTSTDTLAKSGANKNNMSCVSEF